MKARKMKRSRSSEDLADDSLSRYEENQIKQKQKKIARLVKNYETSRKLRHFKCVFQRLKSRKDVAKKLDLFSEKMEKYAVSVKRQLKEQVFEQWLQRHGQGKIQRSEWRQRYKRLYFYRFLENTNHKTCLLYTSPSPRDLSTSRMPSSA